MSRRNQGRRRRTYGRRQHELRERRDGAATESGLWLRDDAWGSADLRDDHRPPADDGYGSFAQ